MRLYQIAELEQLTGIKAHTIRIWEKRYNLIVPERTLTNYRRYNDDQLKKLLNVSTLISNGHKISHIAGFNEKEIFEKILDGQSSKNLDIASASFVNDLLAAMFRYDEAAFDKSYSGAVTRFGLFDAMINVFYPLLNKIGYMWTVNDLNPAQEHFASYLIKRKIMAATDGLPIAKNKNKKFLLALLPGEFHDISLLFANYIIKAKGYDTIYLGQDVPYENIISTIDQTDPSYLLTFFTVSQNPDNLYTDIKERLTLPNGVKLLISGNKTITGYLKDRLIPEILNSPHDLLKYL